MNKQELVISEKYELYKGHAQKIKKLFMSYIVAKKIKIHLFRN